MGEIDISYETNSKINHFPNKLLTVFFCNNLQKKIIHQQKQESFSIKEE